MLNNNNLEIGKSKEFFSEMLSSDHGVYLTWEDLWVTVFHREDASTTKNILQDISGYAFSRSRFGRNGSFWLSFMLYQGNCISTQNKVAKYLLMVTTHKQALSYGTLAYVTQDDALVTTLTLQETVYYSSELLLPASLLKSEKRKIADDCIKEMGLHDAINTRIGGWGCQRLEQWTKEEV